MIARSLSAAALALATFTAGAQDLTVTAPPQVRPVLIENATVHTVSDGVIDDGWVLFDDGEIVALGGPNDPTEAPDARVLDAKGLHVYPGLIGAYTQLGLTEIGAVRATHDYNETGRLTPEVVAITAVNPDSTLLPVTRTAGILSAGVFPTGGLIPGRASAMRLEGWTNDDLSVEDEVGLIVSWPQVRPLDRPIIDTPQERQVELIKKNLAVIDNAFRQAIAYHDARARGISIPTDVRWDAMASFLPTADEQKPVFILAQDVDQITSAVTWATDLGLRPTIVGGRDALLCADLLRAHDVNVILLGTHKYPKRHDSPHDEMFTLPLRLEEAGIEWCLASGAETPHERELGHNAATAVAYGLPVETAIRAVTLSAAEALGIDDELGSIEPGKNATLIITDGNPLEVRTRVLHAFIDGRDVNLSNKQTVLAEKYREKYRQLGLIENDQNQEE